jgi:hypothetical protein
MHHFDAEAGGRPPFLKKKKKSVVNTGPAVLWAATPQAETALGG